MNTGVQHPIGLTPKQQRSVAEYLIDIGFSAFSQTRASLGVVFMISGTPAPRCCWPRALKVVQEILWHSLLSTTADVYTHVLPILMADAAQRMDAALAP